MLGFATSAITESKVRVASRKGVAVPEDCLIDAEGRPTRDPNVAHEPRPHEGGFSLGAWSASPAGVL